MRHSVAVLWALLCLGNAVSGQDAISAVGCSSLPRGNDSCDGALVDDNQRSWAFFGSAYGSWIHVDLGDMYRVTRLTIRQLHNTEDKNFKEIRLDFSDDSSQTVTLAEFDDGYIDEHYTLDQVTTSDVNLTVTQSVGLQFGTTYNGLIFLQFYGFPIAFAQADMMTGASGASDTTTPAPITTAETTAAPTTAAPATTPTSTTQITTPAPIPSPTSSTPATTITFSTTTTTPPTPTPTATPPPSTPTPPTLSPTTRTTTPPPTAPTTPASTTPSTAQTPTPSTTPPTTADEGATTEASTGGGDPDNRTVLYAIAAVIVILVIALVVALAVYFVRRRRAKDKQAEADIIIEEMGPEVGVVNTGFDRSPDRKSGVVARPVPVSNLLDHITALSRAPTGFRDEFVAISTGPRYSISVSSMEENKDKNRFINILAYDHTRVHLYSDAATETDYVNIKDAKGEYINANYINGYKKEKEFIACQGPLNTTVTDFWKMVWQNDCSKIVMVTNLVERGRSKCAYYWPHEGSEQYGHIRVRLEKEDTFPEYIVRILELSKGKEKKTVMQYHFVAWPDEGAPTTGTSLLALQDLINSEPSNGSDGPVVIHCSAGIGRTGTFIAVDYLRKQAAEEGIVDVLGCVDLMRQFRINMVQSLEQYAYIYTTVLEALYCGSVRWPVTEFPGEYAALVESSFEGEETPADKHFKVLEALKPTTYNERIVSALDPVNMPKNRLSTLLPAENVQPFLQQFSGAPSNYINAVMVDSMKAKDVAAITQMPLPHTQIDLWRLVTDHKCNCIVMLNQTSVDSEDAPPYLPPSPDDHVSLGPFVITTRNVTEASDVVITELGIKASHKFKEEKTIQHIRITSWPDNQRLPNSPGLLIDLYKNLMEIKSTLGEGKFLIHCMYGAEKSGLVCAAIFLLEAIEANAYVDVFNVVKRIRRSRPQFVPTPEQYKYLHTVAKEFVETRGSVKNLL